MNKLRTHYIYFYCIDIVDIQREDKAENFCKQNCERLCY